MKILGGVVATLLGFVAALWEAFLTPLMWQWTSGGHAHFVRLPVALLVAMAGNFLLAWYTYVVTGRMLAILGPFLAWSVPMVAFSQKRTEGDLVLAGNNWVAAATLLAGAVAFAVAVYWLTLRSLRRPRDPVVTGAGYESSL
jgi:hypothetical protein